MAVTVLAATIQALRKKRGVTQEQLARHLGVSPQAVSKWENGGYPDGDLLPRLADYFEVSIDYLYGREKEKAPLEQEILEVAQAVWEMDSAKNAENPGDYYELMMRYIWAMHAGTWIGNKFYYERLRTDGETETATLLMNHSGFSYMRLNKNLEFSIVMKEPEDGFASYFKVTDEQAELFGFLSEKDNLKVLFYLLSLKEKEGVRGITVAKALHMKAEKAEAALDYLSGLADRCGVLREMQMLDEYDREEKVYFLSSIHVTGILTLLAGANMVLHPANSFTLECCSRWKAFFERSKLDFLQRDAADTDSKKRKEK